MFFNIKRQTIEKILFLSILSLFIAFNAQAGATDNVSGWVWSKMDDPITPEDEGQIGWISFNCTNQNSCAISDYGVNINSDGTFSGYAWAGGGEDSFGRATTTIGWIRFDPEGPYPVLPDYSTRVDLYTGEVSGWARVCSVFETGCSGALAANDKRGGWEGWIKLRGVAQDGSAYGVSIDKISKEFSGFAWSDMVIGWISFKGAITSFPFIPPNSPPNKPGISGIIWDDCTFKKLSLPVFNWIYSDPDGDSQTASQIKIYGKTTLDTGELACPPTCLSYTPSNDWVRDNLEFGEKTYSWQVKVKDSKGNWSVWSDIHSFQTPLHAYPSPDFIHAPTSPLAGVTVTFTDNSVCYNSNNNPDFCKNLAKRYRWDFGDGESCDSESDAACWGDITHVYLNSMSNTQVRLSITDDLGTCSSFGDTVAGFQIKKPLPWWQEIPPVMFLKKTLLAFIKAFLK
ncbi:MAG: PKD domain-containing protein [Candidatus Omnitrophota bacterium]